MTNKVLASSVRFTDHALFEMGRREIAEEAVLRAIRDPDDQLEISGGRQVLQKVEPFAPDGKVYLVRVVVEPTDEQIVVVTVYRTSKIEKHRRVP